MLIVYLFLCLVLTAAQEDSQCYTADGYPVRCMPKFVNIAFKAQVFSSNTCGDPKSEFCVQQEIGLPFNEDNCYICDKDSPENMHPTLFLTDENEVDNPTWWQSETLYDTDINNMTLHLPFNKSFDIEYIKIEFQSPRPESMVVEKSVDYGRSWEVYQYFSSSCYKTFNKRTDEKIYEWDETKPICTSRDSEISPLQGGVVNFSPLKNRPSAKDLYNTPLLLTWMQATDIRIRLMKMNTFGDQYFSGEKNDVLKTYFYAIRDLSVGGRCTCHGHGGECTSEACRCEHNTAGRNCERCKDIYNDLPWSMSTSDKPFECKRCECNGLADRCVFDEEVFIKSGNVSGGVCLGCRANTAGSKCNECAHGYYPNPVLPVGHIDRCKKCDCDVYGSIGDGACTQELDIDRGLNIGNCQCKPHVLGAACDTCEDGYHSLQLGCVLCDCDPVGTVGDLTLCDKKDGQCKCKDKVAGQNCNECIPGYWNYLIGCEECNCDVAGSISQSCDQTTGQCHCRNGRTGQDCSGTEDGTYIPDIDNETHEPVIEGEGSEDGDGEGGLPDIELKEKGDKVTFKFTVPKDSEFIVFVKYLSNVPIDVNVRYIITADNEPGPNPRCNPQLVQSYNDIISPSPLGTAKIRYPCLNDEVIYTLEVELMDDMSNVPGSVTVMSVTVFTRVSDATTDRLDDLLDGIDDDNNKALEFCEEKAVLLSAKELRELYPACSDVIDSVINDLYNGTLSCDCHPLGANYPDTCEVHGGQCACKPNVFGLKCDKCKPGFHSLSDAGCIVCTCNSIGSTSSICNVKTGVCTCKSGVVGDQCTQCDDGMFGFSSGKGCKTCGCDKIGSLLEQCDQYGQCQCKPGVTGLHCDRCEDGFYGFSGEGCTKCECNNIGGSTSCDQVTGECRCKDNVEGDTCLKCKEGSFSLQQTNPDGCQACFCHGHTSRCLADSGYTNYRTLSNFDNGPEGWIYRVRDTGEEEIAVHSPVTQTIRLSHDKEAALSMCLYAPKKFTGDQLDSYLTNLKLLHNVQGGSPPLSMLSEIRIVGKPYTLTLRPRVTRGDKFIAALHRSASWVASFTTNGSVVPSEAFTARVFQSVLSDVKIIEICAVVHENEELILENFSIGGSRRKTASNQRSVYNVEKCYCPTGYTGSSCGECQDGYKRENPDLGKLSRCVPCECNGYAGTCDPDTGICQDCQHNTAGDFCERCIDGYYGVPGFGNPSSCRRCQCPGNIADGRKSFSDTCELKDGEMVCNDCAEGHIGNRCELCGDGYYGNPESTGADAKCTKCTCNGNIEEGVEGNCDTETGDCLRCTDNTAGRECERCAWGYFGDAITAKNCSKCVCDSVGSNNQYLCDSETGQCDCKPNVEGISCDRCKYGFYNLKSGEGCYDCMCDPIGSVDLQCGEDGVCNCRDGYFGVKCNECSVNYFYEPAQGCSECGCNPEGSESQQCNSNGQCRCKGVVQGKQCDTCPPNMVNLTAGCVSCPDCYSLVATEIAKLNEKLRELKEVIDNTEPSDQSSGVDILEKIKDVQRKVKETLEKATETSDLSNELIEAQKEIEDLITQLQKDAASADQIIANVDATVSNSNRKLAEATAVINKISNDLDTSVKLLLEEGDKFLSEAEEKMDSLSEENKLMQKKANQARKIAEEQDKKSKEAMKMAADAQKLSTTALNTAKQARENLRKTKNKIDQLVADYGEAKENYDLAQNSADSSSKSAAETLQTAQQLADKSCNRPDDLGMDGLAASLKQLEDKAGVAKQTAQNIDDNWQNVYAKSSGILKKVNDLLKRGSAADTTMDELLQEAKSALEQSKVAIAECSKLISEARDLLRFLKNYEAEVRKARENAKKALAELNSLEEQLTEAEGRVDAADVKIGDGQRDMDTILKTIKDVKKNLDDKLDEARATVMKIEGMVKDAEETSEDTDKLREDIAEAAEDISKLRESAKDGTDMLKRILQAADDSKARAESVSSSIVSGNRKLKLLQEKLESIETVDADRLAKLLEQIAESEETLKDLDIDKKINEMRITSVEQNDKIAMYLAEIDRMRQEILTLEEIEANIPDTTACYNPNQ